MDTLLAIAKIRKWTTVEVGDHITFLKDHLKMVVWFHRKGSPVKAALSKFDQTPWVIRENVMNRCVEFLGH